MTHVVILKRQAFWTDNNNKSDTSRQIFIYSSILADANTVMFCIHIKLIEIIYRFILFLSRSIL